ncbi:MAG TPA: ISAs1 family transposase [Candidatus Tectomicrobia bacterium]|nr:ISAs1 family transposase [Candidatus Tectomicrobia bacterium]
MAPIPDATLQWMVPQVDRHEVRQVLVESVRAEVRRKSVRTPAGVLRTLAIDGKCLWRGERGGPDCQQQGSVRGHRVIRALLTSARPQLFIDQYTLGAAENEMGAFEVFWRQLRQAYGRLSLFEAVTLDAGYCSRHNATLIATAGYGYVLGLKENQPELWREARRLLLPLAANQRPEAQVLDRDHGQWVRRRLWRTQECAGWLEWGHLRQIWLVRAEKFMRQTTPRADSVPGVGEDHYYLTNLPWQRLEGSGFLGVVRGHWGIENNRFRRLDMEWHEEQAWCTRGAATDVLGLLRLWAYNLLNLLKGRYLRATCYRRLTVAGFVAWLEQLSVWGEVRRRRRWVVPTR